jgi:hypothetical protein
VSRPVKSRSRSARQQAAGDRTKLRKGDRRRRGERRSRARYSSSEREDSHDVDILSRHQQRNGVPRPPSQEALRASHQQRHHASNRRCDSGSDDDTQHTIREKKAEKRNFWPSMWKVLIDEAKVEWRLYLSVGDAFPNPIKVKDNEINNILQQMFQQFKRKGRRLDKGYFPRYRYELSTLVCCIAQAFPR